MLEVSSLTVRYGGITALSDVSIKIESKEIACIVGANGAGKSTMINAISRTIPSESGQITFDGKSLLELDPTEVVRMGIVQVPEGRRIFPSITVRENLLMGAFTVTDAKQVDENVERMFEHFPILKTRRNQLGGTLSGGEQQMLAIARGLMSNPKLLLLDEPSLGLAPKLILEIFSMIQDLHGRGLTILLVEQNAQKALSISDTAYVLETGRVVTKGEARSLINDPIVKRAYLGHVD